MSADKKSGWRLKVSAFFRGWVHQSNVTLLITYAALLILLWLIFSYVLPVSKGFALTVAALVIVTLIGVAVIGARQIRRMDSTEALTVQDPTGFTLSAQNPSVTLIQSVGIQMLIAAVARPNALIPDGVDPKDSPGKFKQLSDSEALERVKKQIEEALQKNISILQQPPQPAKDATSQGTASIDPKKLPPAPQKET